MDQCQPQPNRKTQPFMVQGIVLVPISHTLAGFVVCTQTKRFCPLGIFISCQPRLKKFKYYDLVSMAARPNEGHDTLAPKQLGFVICSGLELHHFQKKPGC